MDLVRLEFEYSFLLGTKYLTIFISAVHLFSEMYLPVLDEYEKKICLL